MRIFDFLKKPKKDKEGNMTQDEKDIEKAKEDISEKGADTQTERDRIDESVAAQLREQGDEDSQSAKDRVDESEGTRMADEEREEKREGYEDRFTALETKLDRLLELFEKRAEEHAEHMEEKREKYGLSTQPYVREDEEFSSDDVEELLRKTK